MKMMNLAAFAAFKIYEPGLQHIFILYTDIILKYLHAMKILNVLETGLYVYF